MADLHIDRSVEFFLDDGVADDDAFRTSLGVDSYLRVHSEHVLAKYSAALGAHSASTPRRFRQGSFVHSKPIGSLPLDYTLPMAEAEESVSCRRQATNKAVRAERRRDPLTH